MSLFFDYTVVTSLTIFTPKKGQVHISLLSTQITHAGASTMVSKSRYVFQISNGSISTVKFSFVIKGNKDDF